jgi:hypothetical protein
MGLKKNENDGCYFAFWLFVVVCFCLFSVNDEDVSKKNEKRTSYKYYSYIIVTYT